jgi:hypothetical protein
MSFELAVGVPDFSSLWGSEREKKRNHAVFGGECVTRGLRDGGQRERHVSGTRDWKCQLGLEPPRSGSVPLSAR